MVENEQSNSGGTQVGKVCCAARKRLPFRQLSSHERWGTAFLHVTYDRLHVTCARFQPVSGWGQSTGTVWPAIGAANSEIQIARDHSYSNARCKIWWRGAVGGCKTCDVCTPEAD